MRGAYNNPPPSPSVKMKLASFLSLFATLTAFQSTLAVPAGYNSAIRAANKDSSPGSSIQRILEQRRLQGETICTRTDFLGNVTTSCEEASGIQSSCTVTPDGTCEYSALDLSVFEELLANVTDLINVTDLTNVTNSTDDGVSEGDPSFDGIFGALLLLLLGLASSGDCTCTDSTPDCNMTSLADYSFNACTADPKYSNSCVMEQGTVCCDIDDAQGEMKCCRSQTGTVVEYECDAGSDTGKIILANSSCVATYNGQTCTCDYCASDADDLPVTAYDCTEFGGSKRTCPDFGNEESALGLLGAVMGGSLDAALLYEIVDPRKGSGDSNNGGSGDSNNGGSGASNGGFVLSVAAFAISSIVTVGLLF
eukprot:scaffold196_cov113-Cylindrotheca_fusiformis.AAC.3